MTAISKVFALGLIAAIASGSAFAQTAAPAAPAAPAAAPAAAAPAAAPAAKAAAGKAAQTPKSLDCSKQADAKNLHGKERKKFREACKKG